MNPRPLLAAAVLTGGLANFGQPMAMGAEPEPQPTQTQLDFFEKKIRPVLADKCYQCHSESAEKIKGGLVLDTREGIRRGGDNGPAVVPGKLDESLLIEAIRYANKDFAMPPQKAGGKLPESVIRDFEEWIRMDAPDPRDGPARITKANPAEAQNWWSFQPPIKSEPPAVKDTAWPRADLDRFILDGLEEKGLKPAPDADKTTLLRRVYFDLIGLPPTLAEIDRFLTDDAPDLLARTVDRLLASPQFGERWGRHWMDVARFAESSGKDVNIAYPHAWRYRDYVIAAFNSGKPHDQFLREQIAGDLLPSQDAKQKAEQIIATGFLAVGAKSQNEQNPRQFYLDLADEQIDTVSQAILGMTVACARCHDHKFDPIPQRDYYALAGIFLSTDTRYGTAPGRQSRRATELIELPVEAGVPVLDRRLEPAERERKRKQIEADERELRNLVTERIRSARQPQNGASGTEGRSLLRFLQLETRLGLFATELKSFREDGSPKPLAMGVKDLPNSQASTNAASFAGRRNASPMARYRGQRPPEFSIVSDARLQIRGETDRPGERIQRGIPAALSGGFAAEIPEGTSGRLQLAEWLTDRRNPLTARVYVNRVWHWLFGRGLVESCDNFGTTGAKPSNQALLDWLAVTFMDSGWNTKALIRQIVLSRTYALSSDFDSSAFLTDAENTLHWRANKRRLEAEAIRDAMLFASGSLDLTPPLASIVAKNGDGLIGGNRRQRPLGAMGGAQPFGTDEAAILNAAGNHRSVYLPITRDIAPESLTIFDFVDSTLVTGAREKTNVPVQALFLLNSDFVAETSKALASRILRAYPAGPREQNQATLDQRLRYAYWLVFNRAPTANEKQAAVTFFSEFQGSEASTDSLTAWTSFSRALFSAAEFRYLN